MSDEREFNAIRDALLADDPGAVPVRLRARMAAIPVQATPQRATTGWRQRFATFAVPAAILAGVVVIAFVFGGLTHRGQQTASAVPSTPVVSSSPAPSAAPSGAASESAVPSTSPSVDPSASEASPQPTAQPTATPPSSPAPTGPIAIDPSKVIGLMEGTFAVSGDLAYHFGHADTVGYPGIGSIGLTDSTKSGIGFSLENGHDISSYALTDAGVVWMETWYTDPPIDCSNSVPCSPHGGQPVSWTLHLTTLDGKTTKLDGGVVSRISVEGEGATPLPPEMAAQGNRVAYAVPRSVSGSPQASRIQVRSLPDGALIRSIDTKGYVAQLGVFGDALIYRRATDTTGPSDPSNAYLNVVVDDASQPVTLDGPVAQASIGDGGANGNGTVRIAWTPGYGVTPALRWAKLGETKVHSVAILSGAQFVFDPIVIGDGFAWLANVDNADGTSSSQVQAWEPGWTKARLAPDLGSPDTLISTDGWLLVSGGRITVLESMGAPGNAAAVIRAGDVFGN